MSRVKFNVSCTCFHFFIFLFLLACQKRELNYFETIQFNDIKLAKARVGDWRYSHKENFQTFRDFQRSKKIKPQSDKKTIYLQPIGDFNELQKEQIKLTKEYLSIYFQLDAKILPVLSNSVFPKSVRRTKEMNEQILAGYVLDSILIQRKPKDAVVLMGITEKDLFPRPEWNFVFGLASYQDCVGVTSMYRFSDGYLTDFNFNKSLERLIKISSHEIGHMFGISHCLNANCVMNGTNSLSETDFHLARACSLCQLKLNSSLKYDNQKRLAELRKFFESRHLNSELAHVEKDIKLLK